MIEFDKELTAISMYYLNLAERAKLRSKEEMQYDSEVLNGKRKGKVTYIKLNQNEKIKETRRK